MNYYRIVWLIILVIIGVAGAIATHDAPLTSGTGFLMGFGFAVSLYFCFEVEGTNVVKKEVK